MPLYFAYGANMDAAAMAARCPRSRPVGTGRLARHRFFITADGYASVMRDPRGSVHGVLWDLALADVPALDRFEEVGRGLYGKILQPVIAGNGARRAMVYLARSLEPGAPRPGYLEQVLAAAAHWELPQAYRSEIARLLPQAARPAPVRPRFAAPTDRGRQ